MELKDLLPIIISGISLLLSSYVIFENIKNNINKTKERKIELKLLFSNFRKEVSYNIDLIMKIIKRADVPNAVYDMIVRNLINELSFNLLKSVYEEFPLLMEKNIEIINNPTPDINLNHIKDLIKNSYETIEKLHRDLKIVSDEPLANAPVILLKRRLEPLKNKLEEIKKAFKYIKVKKDIRN